MTHALLATGLAAFVAFQAIGVAGGIVTIVMRKRIFG